MTAYLRAAILLGFGLMVAAGMTVAVINYAVALATRSS